LTSRLLSMLRSCDRVANDCLPSTTPIWETVGIRLLRSGEWDRKEGVLVVLFENDDGAREFAALAVGLVADVFAESYPPHLAFAKIQSRGFVRGVGGFLDAVPVIEIRLHTMVANIIPRAAWASDMQKR
jgi:hypothetical protein